MKVMMYETQGDSAITSCTVKNQFVEAIVMRSCNSEIRKVRKKEKSITGKIGKAKIRKETLLSDRRNGRQEEDAEETNLGMEEVVLLGNVHKNMNEENTFRKSSS